MELLEGKITVKPLCFPLQLSFTPHPSLALPYSSQQRNSSFLTIVYHCERSGKITERTVRGWDHHEAPLVPFTPHPSTLPHSSQQRNSPMTPFHTIFYHSRRNSRRPQVPASEPKHQHQSESLVLLLLFSTTWYLTCLPAVLLLLFSTTWTNFLGSCFDCVNEWFFHVSKSQYFVFNLSHIILCFVSTLTRKKHLFTEPNSASKNTFLSCHT